MSADVPLEFPDVAAMDTRIRVKVVNSTQAADFTCSLGT